MVSSMFAFPPTAILGDLKVSDTWSLMMSTVPKGPLKPQMALRSRDEVSVWIILNLETLLEEEVVDLAIEVVVVGVVDLVIEVVDLVIEVVDSVIGVVAAVVVVVVVLTAEVVVVIVVVAVAVAPEA